MDRSNDLSVSWYKLLIFCELCLINPGRTAARDKRKVSLQSRSRIRIQSRLVTVVFVCRGERKSIRPKKELSETLRKVVRQLMRAEHANPGPRIRSGAAQGGSLAPPSRASQSSAASSASFASILSAPSIHAPQPLPPLNVNWVRTLTSSEPLVNWTAEPASCSS